MPITERGLKVYILLVIYIYILVTEVFLSLTQSHFALRKRPLVAMGKLPPALIICPEISLSDVHCTRLYSAEVCGCDFEISY